MRTGVLLWTVAAVATAQPAQSAAAEPIDRANTSLLDSAGPSAPTAHHGQGIPDTSAQVSAAATEPQLFFRAAGVPVSLTLTGYFQVDTVMVNEGSQDEVNPATAQPLNQNRILLRRGRIRAGADQGVFSAGVEIEADTLQGLTLRLAEADVSARWSNPEPGAPPYLAFSAGLLQIPFGYEASLLARNRYFLEPTGFARALFPGSYDLGLRLKGGWKILRYELAMMNGEPIGERAFPGLDPNAGKDWIGRVGVVTHPVDALTIEAGLSGLEGSGFHPGTPSTKDSTVWRDLNEDSVVQLTELYVLPGQASTPSESFRRFAIGGDFRVHWVSRFGVLTVQAEIVRGVDLDRGAYVADPVAVGRSLRELGWSVAVMHELPWAVTLGARYD
ncbi:MAG: hypothetical protein ACT4TC_12030, partial [Myxococcaceae bacterium]